MTTDHTDDVMFEIVSALATVDDVEPSNLDYEIAEYVNPIALGNLFATKGTYWECSFEVPRHEVTVTHTGGVYIDGTHRRTIGEDTQQDADHHIQETHRYRQSVLRKNPAMLYRCRPCRDRPMEFVSDGCEGVTGYTSNAFTIGGVSYGADVIHSGDRQRVWNAIQASLRRCEQFTLQYRIERADHEEQLVWETGNGVFVDDEAVALVGAITSPPGAQTHESRRGWTLRSEEYAP